MNRLYVGIDWATETHHACVMDAEGNAKARFSFSHDPAGLEQLFQRVRTLKSLHRAVYVLERSEGLLVDALLGRSEEVWYINPKQAHRFRERYTLAGAKDDPRDAWVLANAARTDGDLFRHVTPRPVLLLQLRGAERRHTALGLEVVRQVAKARSALAEYYPNFLQVSDDLDRDWVRALWRLVPTPEAARAVRPHRVQRLLTEHHVRVHSAAEVVAILRDNALVASAGAVAAAEPLVAALLDTLDVVVRHQRIAERDIEALLRDIGAGKVTDPLPVAVGEAPEGETSAARVSDAGVAPPGSTPASADWAVTATAVQSMPGVGSKICAVVMAEAPEALQEANYRELRAVAGAAPVTDATGKRSKRRATVKMRHACNERLRNVIHMWGSSAATADPYWKAYRQGLLERGHTVARANRQVADRLLAVLCALIRTKTTYDATRFQLAVA